MYVIGFRQDNKVVGDPYFYHHGANLLVHGKGFIAPLQYIALHIRMDAADHPPLYMLFLSIPSALRLDTPLAHMIWSACLGAATIALTGLVGRAVAGNRVGLIAAAIVAISPNVWIYDGAILSETMAIFVRDVGAAARVPGVGAADPATRLRARRGVWIRDARPLRVGAPGAGAVVAGRALRRPRVLACPLVRARPPRPA